MVGYNARIHVAEEQQLVKLSGEGTINLERQLI